MGAAESEVITVRGDGVIVEKTFEPDEFPVPAIAFTIRSERDEAAEIRLVDVLPETVSPGDAGFHPDYGEEFWSVQDGRIVFEREFDPGEAFTTVYAVRDSDISTIERFLVEPDLDRIEPTTQEDSQVVRDVLAGDSERVPSFDEDADEEEDEEIEPLNLVDPSGDGSAAPDQSADPGAAPPSAGTDSGSGEEAAGPSGPELESEPEEDSGPSGPELESEPEPEDESGESVSVERGVAATLAEEIRRGEVDEAVVETLRDALDAGGDAESGDATMQARIRHLQTQVSDLQAYTDALEAFLDENGTAQQTLEATREELEATDQRLEELSGTIRENTAAVDELEASVSTVEEELVDAADAVDELETEVDGRVGDVEDRVDGLASRVVEAEDLDRVEGRIDGVESDVDSLRELTESLENVEDDLEDRLNDIESDIRAIHDDIESFRQFRESVSDVFGQLGGGDAPDHE